MLVLATMTAPPARRRRTDRRIGGRRRSLLGRSTFEPARVGSPATSNRSLMLTITPVERAERYAKAAAHRRRAAVRARAVSV